MEKGGNYVQAVNQSVNQDMNQGGHQNGHQGGIQGVMQGVNQGVNQVFHQGVNTGVNQWHQNLFGCFDNVGLCVITFLVPCYTFGKNAEALGEDCLLCGCLMCCLPEVAFGAQLVLRHRLREMRNIEGSLTKDIILTVLCGCCTLCQEGQEIRMMQGQDMAGDGDEKIARF